jgi:hypothetical protein
MGVFPHDPAWKAPSVVLGRKLKAWPDLIFAAVVEGALVWA